MSAAARLGRRFGNHLYRVAFSFYRPLYSAFKAYQDRAERRLLTGWLSPGAVVVDAGANIGIYSRFLAGCVGPTGTVHSFEPSPDNFAHLRDLVSHLPNVRPNPVAVSDKTGESLLYLSDDLNVDHRAYSTEGEPRRTVLVQFTRLDDYFETGARVDFIKMDIQGFELHALRGAERILTENPQIRLQVEFWPYGLVKAGDSPEAVASFLQEHELHAAALKRGELIPFEFSTIDPSDPTQYTNLFVQSRSRRAEPRKATMRG